MEKEAVYSGDDEETVKFFEAYIENLGLTKEEYWNEYRPPELKRYLTHLKVQEHVFKKHIKNNINANKLENETEEDYTNYVKKYYEQNMKIKIENSNYISRLK